MAKIGFVCLNSSHLLNCSNCTCMGWVAMTDTLRRNCGVERTAACVIVRFGGSASLDSPCQ